MRIRTVKGGADTTRTRQTVRPTALTVRREHVRRARRRGARAHLRLVARRVLRGAAHQRRGRERTRIGAARAVRRVAHRTRGELARRRVAARRVRALPRVALLARLDDPVPAHAERDRVLRVRGVDQAARVRHPAGVAQHQRAYQ